MILFLMSYKGYFTLQALVNSRFKKLITLVIIGEDKNVQNDYSLAIKRICEQQQIKWLDRKSFSERLATADYALAISWRWLIKLERIKLLVMHDSILPKYRGFAPLISQLINNEPCIGVTLLIATEVYDEGDIVALEKVNITYPIKIKEAIDLVSNCYVKLVLFMCETLETKGYLAAREQDHNAATYSLWRDNQDYFIDWNWDAKYIKRFIDALGFPYLGAQTFLNEKHIIIREGEVVEDLQIVNRNVGKVIFMKQGLPIVVCGTGLIKITNAVFVEDNKSIFPLKKFRTRFHN